MIGQRATHLVDQLLAEQSRHLLLQTLRLHIDHIDLRQLDIRITSQKLHKTIFLCLCGKIIAFYRRSGRAEQNLCIMNFSKHYCRITGMIARSRIILFVGVFMLFIHNHDSKITEWKEDRRADTENHFVFLFWREHILPHLNSLIIREFGVIDTKLFAKHTTKTSRQLSGESNLRKQEQRLFAACNGFINKFDINLRFSARGDSMQKHNIFLLEIGNNLIVGFILGIGKWIAIHHISKFTIVDPANLLVVKAENILFYQSL